MATLIRSAAHDVGTSIHNGFGVSQFIVLLKGGDSIGRIHQRWASTHVNCHAKRLLDLLPACAQLHQCFDMEADTAVAMCCNAKRKRDQFFCLLVQRAAAQSGISERRKPVQGIRDVCAAF